MGYRHLLSPEGLSKFENLVTPDDYKGKKSYDITVVMSKEDTDAIRETIAEEEKAARAEFEEKHPDEEYIFRKAGKPERGYDSDAKKKTDELTGNFEVKFNSKRPPFIVDSKLKAISSEDFRLPFGSRVVVDYTPVPYAIGTGTVGVKLQLNAVQVLEIADGAGTSQGSTMFTEQASGFVYQDTGDHDPEAAPVGGEPSDFDFDDSDETG
jgi:hypothetical protein